MVKPKKDLTGMKFGRLTVVKQSENDYVQKNGTRHSKWWCKCDCGNPELIEVIGTNLTRGNTTSCGCYHYEKITAQFRDMKYNKYDLSGDYGVGYCSNNNAEFYFDLDDYDKIKGYTWFQDKKGYIVANNVYDGRTDGIHDIIKLHNLIFGKYADHANRNRADNRKSNLRKATAEENARNSSLASNNTSGIIGVQWHKISQKWQIRINYNKIRYTLCTKEDFTEAVRYRLQAEYDCYGVDFAPQRHLFEQYKIPDKEISEDIKRLMKKADERRERNKK